MVVPSGSIVGPLALTKGRFGLRQLNGPCRHLAVYSLAYEMQVRVRFVPTEVNVADEASRRWSGPERIQSSSPSRFGASGIAIGIVALTAGAEFGYPFNVTGTDLPEATP